MSHADTLRDLAGNYDHPDRDALLAGADALDTLTKVREVLDRLRQERIRHETQNNRGPYVCGYWDGTKNAHTWINEALGGTP